MVTHFTSKRPTSRWTLAFCCNMLDVMALAAFCICKKVDGLRKSDARRDFLTTLSETLVLANIENRMNKSSVISQFATRLATESSLFLSSTFFEMSQNKEQKRTNKNCISSQTQKLFSIIFASVGSSIHAKTNECGKKFKKYTCDASNWPRICHIFLYKCK